MSRLSRKKVLITFGRSFLALHLARLMGAAGHEVLISDSVHFPITRFSASVTKTFRTPRPRYEPVEWTHALADIVRDEGVDLVVTIHEGTEILANTIEKYPDLFPDSCTLFFSGFDVEARLENKYEFQSALARLGIPTLDFALVRSQKDLEAVDFDTFALKRVYSRGSQEVYKVRPGEFPSGLMFDPNNPWIAQEWAEGTNYCSYSVCHDGEVKAHAVYPVRYAIEGTSCLTFESVEHEGIDAWVRECVKAFNFTGQLGFDFVEVPDRGLFTVECNPRSTSGVLLFDPETNVDRAFFGVNDDVIAPQPGASKVLGPGMLMYGWRKSARKDKTLLQYLRDYRRTDGVISSRRDLGPSLALPLAMGNILAEATRYRVNIPEAFMHDHEWDGAED
ncbi:ATP-grasp domain protein [Mycolicibacterium chubuense NBB4]|uniref:ATP-grasp domain protein n=1 Tax=Mycolicibacterium chubuense (strain NBB4) TaxID=710421 RepID=I4BD35_MYCCN|nr:ATP-grasp domain-containing protein [Mycolicibacterium chubuense]AFM15192.1 ATP-grasp domain protein [Mycolicibacterium chubuense NBB4]